MIPSSFLSELWREFVHSLEGKTYISKEEMNSFFNEIYSKSLRLYESRHFQFLTQEEKEWLKNSWKFKNEAKDLIIKKAEEQEVLIPFEREWVIHIENLSVEKQATKWEIVKHHWDKRMGIW